MSERLSVEQYAMALAHVAALRSEDPYTKVGAVALNFNNRVIGTGYNGLSPGLVPPAGFWENREARLDVVCHAEQNLLAQFVRGSAKVVAVTIMPCEACARSLIAHDVKLVLYGIPYWRTSKSLDIFAFHNVEIRQVEVDMPTLFQPRCHCEH